MKILNSRLVVLVTVALMLVAAPSADAKRHPTNRARIHALEKQMTRLAAEVDALSAAFEHEKEEAAATRIRLASLLNCLALAPVGVDRTGLVPVFQPFGPDLAVFFNQSCVVPIQPKQPDTFSIHPVQLAFAY